LAYIWKGEWEEEGGGTWEKEKERGEAGERGRELGGDAGQYKMIRSDLFFLLKPAPRAPFRQFCPVIVHVQYPTPLCPVSDTCVQ